MIVFGPRRQKGRRHFRTIPAGGIECPQAPAVMGVAANSSFYKILIFNDYGIEA
jgi:hypothetical protein